MEKTKLSIAAVGCSGKVTEVFIDGLLKQGIRVRILARDADAVSARYPDAEVIKGSMMNPSDVSKVMSGADAALLVTPMSKRNNASIEIQAAEAAIEGAKKSNLRHLIYVSTIGADRKCGLPLLDAKYEVERLISNSDIPWTSLRCGSYMEDVFDNQLAMIRKGTFMFPVRKDRRFTYTSQADLAPFIADELLKKKRVLNQAINFVTPGTFSIFEVEAMLTRASGRTVKGVGKFPLYYILKSLQPYFFLINHRFSTIIPLLGYFNKFGYTDSGETVSDLFPSFHMTTLDEHFRILRPDNRKRPS